MEKRFTIFDFLSEAFNIFSVTIVFVTIVAMTSGSSAESISSMYQYGYKAIPTFTILQFLFTSFILETLKIFWYSERVFKNLMILWRTIFMLLSIIASMTVCIICFKWFPIDDLAAWGGFFISFGICFLMSLIVMVLKTRLESKKFEEGFRSYQKNHDMGGEG